MGVTALFDLTGMTLYQRMRPVLPPSPPRQDEDPFAAALATILSARQQPADPAPDESGDALPP